jgi:hypothetical protein
MPDYPPILNVPASKSFRDLNEVQVTLLFDEPKEFEGKFGPQWKYSVEVDGVEHTLFASNALNRLIQEQSPIKGTTLSIARVGEKKDTKWDVVYVSGPKGDNSVTSGSGRDEGGGSGTQARGGSPERFVDDLALYWQAFDLATETLKAKGLEPQADINAVAFVIYKLAKDNGVLDPYDPMAGVPTQTEQAEVNGKNKMRAELEAMFRITRLPEEHWMTVLNGHRVDGAPEIVTWDDVTRDVGLAVYATCKNVQSGAATWDEYLVAPSNADDQPDLPF